MRLKVEQDFKIEEYEEFYEHHYFAPVKDEEAINAHRLFPRVRWALNIAKQVRPRRVLDLGCLEGYAVLTLANHVDSVERGVGVDLSEEAIDLANGRTELVKTAMCEFFKESIETWMETTRERFDFVMAFELMEHVKDPNLVFDLIDKITTPNAHVLISTPAFESPKFGKDDEKNKCHIRLYTLKDSDYQEHNKYGTLRTATSLPKQLGPKRKIISSEVKSELINLHYQTNIS